MEKAAERRAGPDRAGVDSGPGSAVGAGTRSREAPECKQSSRAPVQGSRRSPESLFYDGLRKRVSRARRLEWLAPALGEMLLP